MQLSSIIPWGRSLAEYRAMFMLTENDLKQRILGCSDGPASFNAELTQRGGQVISIDPIYQFSQQQISQRIDDVYDEVLTQVRANRSDFNWETIRTPAHLGEIRLKAMKCFLDDYGLGLEQNRYQNQSLPSLNFADKQFDLALCSHYLFLYSDHLSLEHHIKAILELCRVAKEVRIYPLVTLKNEISVYVDTVIAKLISQGLEATLQAVDYRFQSNASQMLVINT
jgi:hypothetical protein